MLMVSKISSFNDPFECAYRITGDITLESCKTWIRSRWDSSDFLQMILEVRPELKTPKKAKRHLKANITFWADHFYKNRHAVERKLREIRTTFMDREMRVASFSSNKAKPADEILMWAHYSNKHRGIRIGFEFPENKQRYGIAPMNYRPERAVFDISKQPLTDPTNAQMREIMRTKSEVWKYEDEYRLITASSICYRKPPPNDVLEFLPFDSAWVRRVDFGLHHDVSTRDKMIKDLATQYPHVSWFQAVYHDEEFALCYQPIISNAEPTRQPNRVMVRLP